MGSVMTDCVVMVSKKPSFCALNEENALLKAGVSLVSDIVKQLVSGDFSTSVTFNLTMRDSPRYDLSVASPRPNAKLALA